MPQNINPYSTAQAAFATTWTVVETGTDNVDVVCTKAAEEGKRHFITFLAVSTDGRLHNAAEGIGAVLKSGSDIKYEMWPRGLLQQSSQLWPIIGELMMLGASVPKTIGMDSDSGPWYVEFESPIQMGENETATFTSDLEGINDTVTFTMGGFTSDNTVY